MLKLKIFSAEEAEAGDGAEEKKRQKRGGKGAPKPPKKAAAADQKITLSRAPRGKNKFVTVVGGLSTYGKREMDLIFGAGNIALLFRNRLESCSEVFCSTFRLWIIGNRTG
jgi:hypothetical protein